MPTVIIVGIWIVVFKLIENDLIHTAHLFSHFFPPIYRALNQKRIEKTPVDHAKLHIKDHTSISSSNNTMVVNLTVAAVVLAVEAEEDTTTTKARTGIISSNSNTIHEWCLGHQV